MMKFCFPTMIGFPKTIVRMVPRAFNDNWELKMTLKIRPEISLKLRNSLGNNNRTVFNLPVNNWGNLKILENNATQFFY